MKLGYQPPRSLEEWGACLEYKYAFDDIGLPFDVLKEWKRYGVASTFYDDLAREGSGSVRKLMRKVSGWRLKNQNYAFPRTEALPRLREDDRPEDAGRRHQARHDLRCHAQRSHDVNT